jgi:hypothetical protein
MTSVSSPADDNACAGNAMPIARGIIARDRMRAVSRASAAIGGRTCACGPRSNLRSEQSDCTSEEETRSTMMKRLFALTAVTLALIAGMPFALAQSSPPPLPALTAQQSATVQQRLDTYRQQTEARVSRGEITPDEADNLLEWREWQIARQVAGITPAPPARSEVPPDYYEPPRRDVVVVQPAPYYGPYYRYPAPYWGPYPYYGDPAVCAGGFGRHFGGRICF